VRIGALLPLTGSGANYGAYARNGMDLAVAEINDAGGVGGKLVSVTYEDSRSDPAVGVTGFQKLTDVNKVPATLTEFSPVVMACAPIANAKKSVLLNCGAQTPKVRQAGAFVFSAIPDANEEAVQMAQFAYKTLGLRKVATFCINTETGIATTSVFVGHFKGLGGKILGDEKHNQGATDFRASLTKLKSLRPQAAYMISLTQESALILKQAAEMGLKTQWLSYTSFQGQAIQTVAQSAAEGVIYTYPQFDPKASERSRTFEATYSKRYSQAPEVYAATFYDGVYAIKAAMEKAGMSGEAVQKGLKQIVYQGVAGAIDFSKANWVDKPLQLRTVKGGQFVVYTPVRK
jgi:branched-chain amino acid transport system substrate-binding protein